MFSNESANPLVSLAFNANKIQEEIGDFENGLKKLYEITGVNDVNEVIQKFITQDETEKSLSETRDDYLSRLELLQHVKARLRSDIENLKFYKNVLVGNLQLEKAEQSYNKLYMQHDRY